MQQLLHRFFHPLLIWHTNRWFFWLKSIDIIYRNSLFTMKNICLHCKNTWYFIFGYLSKNQIIHKTLPL